MKLHGVFPPLTTPFASDGSLALDKLARNIERYNRTPLSGYVVLGSTGEAVLLTREESERVLAAARGAAASGRVLIAGTGAENTEETIARTNRAAELGYQVALVRTPSYYKPQLSSDAQVAHYLRVADAARIPILIYSVPQFTGVNVEAPLVARLAQHPNIVGIKESSGDVRRAAEIVDAVPPNFQTLVGSAPTFYPSLATGAVGGILALACVYPELCVELYQVAVDRDAGKAQALQQLLHGPSLTIVGKLGVPGVKHAMDLLGYYGGPARRPLLPLTDAQKKEVELALVAVSQSELAGRTRRFGTASSPS
jgi:4-hydroxy-2-oxoglutarate aldolase